jgi:hypothetical protein
VTGDGVNVRDCAERAQLGPMVSAQLSYPISFRIIIDQISQITLTCSQMVAYMVS